MPNLDEAGAYLGCQPTNASAMQGLDRLRQIGCVKVARHAVSITELDAYIESHTVKLGEDPWGLTGIGLQHVRQGRPEGRGRTF